MVHLGNLNEGFHLPLSVEAFQEWQEMTQLISEVHLSEQQFDQRTFVWGAKYTPSKFYKFLFARLPQDAALNAIWKSRAMPKLKVFTWLLFQDRLNTRDLMQRKHWFIDSGYNCVMCSQNMLETSQHLFFQCVFAQQCWDLLDIHWDFSRDFETNYTATKASFTGPCFFEIIACATWNIWKVRNDLIFNNISTDFGRWRVCFQSDLLLHRYRVKSGCIQPLVEWIASIFL
jgi:Fe-S cluster biosynthesis and repair protein YggX